MFAFGRDTEDGFEFLVSTKGAVYTYPLKSLVLKDFPPIAHVWDVYEIGPEMLVATLVKVKDHAAKSPEHIELDYDHKFALWSAYPYKSLLNWEPCEAEMTL